MTKRFSPSLLPSLTIILSLAVAAHAAPKVQRAKQVYCAFQLARGHMQNLQIKPDDLKMIVPLKEVASTENAQPIQDLVGSFTQEFPATDRKGQTAYVAKGTVRVVAGGSRWKNGLDRLDLTIALYDKSHGKMLAISHHKSSHLFSPVMEQAMEENDEIKVISRTINPEIFEKIQSESYGSLEDNFERKGYEWTVYDAEKKGMISEDIAFTLDAICDYQ